MEDIASPMAHTALPIGEPCPPNSLGMKVACGGERLPTVGRRTLLCGVLSAIGPSSALADARPSTGEIRSDWLDFRNRFVRNDGRVVDTGNAGVSHTEGQGWGLLFAEHCDDQATFERILGWTARTLRRPHDSLHAWRYRPTSSHRVSDNNNATDGDLIIAWALAKAARRWGEPDYAQSAASIAQDILRYLTARVEGELLLLPGVDGFESAEVVVVNPSYSVFPAFPVLASLAPSDSWAELQQSGIGLINRGRFGRWMLPPDWLQIGRVDGQLAPAPGWPPLCSFDAIRVPLYLAWAGLSSPASGAFAAFYEPRAGSPPPAWVNLETQAEAPYAAPSGMLAVAQIASMVGDMSPAAAITFPRVADASDYYSAALTLLAKIAWQECRGT